MRICFTTPSITPFSAGNVLRSCAALGNAVGLQRLIGLEAAAHVLMRCLGVGFIVGCGLHTALRLSELHIQICHVDFLSSRTGIVQPQSSVSEL